jgi:NAD(P)-dependent dehydrogenase (short-subunit alcohol dehydrogenase family)
MSKRVVIFGASGGIGSATCEAFRNAGYLVTPIAGRQINFVYMASHSDVDDVLEQVEPDIIVNCVGHFDKTNKETHCNTFDINVGSNWAIIKHYIDTPGKKPVKIIMVGSSSYLSGRKAYILYAASKAALYNLWQGACDYFSNTDITVSLINPVRTRTPLIDMSTPAVCLTPNDVALEILSMASNNSNQLVDMKYPEEN